MLLLSVIRGLSHASNDGIVVLLGNLRNHVKHLLGVGALPENLPQSRKLWALSRHCLFVPLDGLCRRLHGIFDLCLALCEVCVLRGEVDSTRSRGTFKLCAIHDNGLRIHRHGDARDWLQDFALLERAARRKCGCKPCMVIHRRLLLLRHFLDVDRVLRFSCLGASLSFILDLSMRAGAPATAPLHVAVAPCDVLVVDAGLFETLCKVGQLSDGGAIGNGLQDTSSSVRWSLSRGRGPLRARCFELRDHVVRSPANRSMLLCGRVNILQGLGCNVARDGRRLR
mmetsp:Transcript_35137/g.76736  ORF Transcript_35137/g.76736 Transcript_35137/m.76736 type:complete len:283 (+) Transcript_35137:498-1346(+)